MRNVLLIIGDTHFGVRNNSMTWLKHQKAGFEEIINYINTNEVGLEPSDKLTVVHVGDLFDSRSAINPMVWRGVEELLNKMDNALAEVSGRMYIIGGNHDYYYPWESDNNFTSIKMLPKFNNIEIVVDKAVIDPNIGALLIPWFVFHNKQMLRDAIRHSFNLTDIIITHTDPFHMDPGIQNIIKGHCLITGHIHQPKDEWEDGGLLVTGATYPIDFTDTNSQRGFWTLIDSDDLTFHPIHSSIHFHTINEDELENWKDLGIQDDDYVEILIKQSHVDDHKKTIKELTDNFGAILTPIAESEHILFESTDILNVDTVCKRMLPDKLKSVYQKMVDACKKKE